MLSSPLLIKNTCVTSELQLLFSWCVNGTSSLWKDMNLIPLIFVSIKAIVWGEGMILMSLDFYGVKHNNSCFSDTWKKQWQEVTLLWVQLKTHDKHLPYFNLCVTHNLLLLCFCCYILILPPEFHWKWTSLSLLVGCLTFLTCCYGCARRMWLDLQSSRSDPSKSLQCEYCG